MWSMKKVEDIIWNKNALVPIPILNQTVFIVFNTIHNGGPYSKDHVSTQKKLV